jgi:L-alanine-DL-glutamate epimerase-like enolase superfamily enzyme
MSNDSPVTLVAVETTVYSLPMHGALRWGKSSRLDAATHVAVRVVLSNGAEGWAEAPPRPTIYGETIYSIPAVIRHELAPRVVGLPVWAAEDGAAPPWASPRLRRIQARLHEIKNNHTAKAAIDMALHAAISEQRGSTLLDHLAAGQPTAGRVRVSYILGIGDRDTVLSEARRVVDAGVRVLKVKVGRDWDDDLARICDLQAELGPRVDLYADANECMDAAEAPAKLDRLAELGLYYCEEPLPVEQIAQRSALRARGHLPLIADDSAFTLRDLQRELAFDTFDILNIKTARNGFTESAAMLDAATAAGKGVMIGSQASTGLGTLHAAAFAALPGIDHPSELSFWLKLREDILDRPLRLDDGYLDLADIAATRLDPARLAAAAI